VGAYTNAPPEAFRAKAKRLDPGVKVPVAAPSWAPCRTPEASCWSVLPAVAGNWLLRGRSAGPSSATAGGGADVVVALEVDVSEVTEEVEELLEDPQAERARLASSASKKLARRGMGCVMVIAPRDARQGARLPGSC
jgi:hypothetical protein